MSKGSDVKSIPESTKVIIARSISKNGDFDLVYDEIQALAGRASQEQVVDLYLFIRDHSQRLEEEWRDEFIELFSDFEEALPPLQYE